MTFLVFKNKVSDSSNYHRICTIIKHCDNGANNSDNKR